MPLPVVFLIAALTLGVWSIGAAAEPVPEKVTEVLQRLFPESPPDGVRPSAVPGLYEVIYGGQVFYISADGRYALEGELVDLELRESLTERARAAQRVKLIGALDPGTLITFSPESVRHVVTVFTDIDCPYCRKMHQEMAEYLKQGIAIRYAAFPRTGVGSESFQKAVAVWCAEDRQRAMTLAKAGQPVQSRPCKDPVRDHLALVERLGLSGTPSLIFADGTLAPGYVPAEKLLQMLEARPGR